MAEKVHLDGALQIMYMNVTIMTDVTDISPSEYRNTINIVTTMKRKYYEALSACAIDLMRAAWHNRMREMHSSADSPDIMLILVEAYILTTILQTQTVMVLGVCGWKCCGMREHWNNNKARRIISNTQKDAACYHARRIPSMIDNELKCIMHKAIVSLIIVIVVCKWIMPNIEVEQSEIFDSNKGYPGEGPEVERCAYRNVAIEYSEIFDSTKGYPGEGPGTDRRGKSKSASTARGDVKWEPTLKLWTGMNNKTKKATGEMHTVGHDLWYKAPPKLQWDRLKGSIMGLNMAGWGESLDRMTLWSHMAACRTMIMVLYDHRRQECQRLNMQNEIEIGWTGTCSEHKIAWSHAMAKNKNIGGITIAVHPAIARYARNFDKGCDPRGWGRWTAIELHGRKRKTIIIGTYAPTANNDEDASNSMWQRQLTAMDKIPDCQREKNPLAQYISDLDDTVAKIKAHKENYIVIIVGDTNINLHKDTAESRAWRENMADRGLVNTGKWWPSRRHQCHTWHNGQNKSWIDHIYAPAEIMCDGSIVDAGIETGKTSYK